MKAPSVLLRRLFDAAVASAQPALCVPPHLPKTPPRGRLVIIGAGKASAAMARAVEDHWPGPLEGLVVIRYGHGDPCQRVEVVEAAHPVPDRAGVAAAERILELVRRLGPEDLVLPHLGERLIASGEPGRGLDPGRQADGEQRASAQWRDDLRNELPASPPLVNQGWPPRRRLPSRAGDQSADFGRAGRPLIDIASGPTVADPTTCGDALEIVSRYGITLPQAARRMLESGEGESATGRPAAADRRDDVGRRAATGPRSRGRGRPERRLCRPHTW